MAIQKTVSASPSPQTSGLSRPATVGVVFALLIVIVVVGAVIILVVVIWWVIFSVLESICVHLTHNLLMDNNSIVD